MTTNITFDNAAMANAAHKILAPFTESGPYAGQIVTLTVAGDQFIAATDGATLRAIAPKAVSAHVPASGTYEMTTFERVGRLGVSHGVTAMIESAVSGQTQIEFDRTRAGRLLRDWLRDGDKVSRAAQSAAYRRELANWDDARKSARAARDVALAAYKAGTGPKPVRLPAHAAEKPKWSDWTIPYNHRTMVVEIWADDGVVKIGRNNSELDEHPLGRVATGDGDTRRLTACDARLLLRVLRSFNGPIVRLLFDDVASPVAVRDVCDPDNGFAIVMPTRIRLSKYQCLT